MIANPKNSSENSRPCGYLPPYVLKRLAESDNRNLRRVAFATESAGAAARQRRLMRREFLQGRAIVPIHGKGRSIYGMNNGDYPLPGDLIRGEDSTGSPDDAANEAYENSGTTYDFYRELFERRSLDGDGYPLTSSVHYGIDGIRRWR
jgi:Zn-dependent metalloprotease